MKSIDDMDDAIQAITGYEICKLRYWMDCVVEEMDDIKKKCPFRCLSTVGFQLPHMSHEETEEFEHRFTENIENYYTKSFGECIYCAMFGAKYKEHIDYSNYSTAPVICPCGLFEKTDTLIDLISTELHDNSKLVNKKVAQFKKDLEEYINIQRK